MEVYFLIPQLLLDVKGLNKNSANLSASSLSSLATRRLLNDEQRKIELLLTVTKGGWGLGTGGGERQF